MSRFAKNVAIMVIAPFVTQLLSFLITPLITRLYLPEDFGALALFGAILMPFAIFSNMGYHSAIVVAETEVDVANIFTLNIFLTIIVAILSFPLILLKDSALLSFFHAESIKDYLWLIPLSILFHGFYMSFRYYNIRKRSFGNISAAKIGRFIIDNGIILIAGFTGVASSFFLIIGTFAGGVSATTILTKSFWKNCNSFFKSISSKSIIMVAKKYSKFPKFMLLTELISRISSQLPVYMLAIYFSSSIIGYYALGLRLLTVPLNFLGSNIGEVFFEKASQNRVNNKVILNKLFMYLLFIALPIFCFLAILGSDIFFVIFGKEWVEAGVYVQILTLFMFSKFITIPASYLMLVYEKQEFSVYLNIATAFVSMISLVIGGYFSNIYIALGLYSFFNSLVILIYGFGLMRYAGLHLRTIMGQVLIMLIYSLPFIIIVIALKYYFINSPINSLLYGSLVLTIFYCILVFLKVEFRQLFFEIINSIKRKTKKSFII